jgi:HSP20 family protein
MRDLLNMHARFAGLPGNGDDSYGSWAPAVDIFERGDDLVIRAEIPGVEKDDIDINVEHNTLSIRGERKREEEFDEGRTYKMERVFGSFVRTFRLPRTVDSSRISASYHNGVLELHLPKAEEAKPRRIEITVH